MTAGCGKVARRRATKTTGLRSLRRYAGATGTVVALALAALAVPGTGLIEPVAAAATAVGAGTSTAVQEVKVPAADLESVGIPGGLSGPVLLHHQPALTAGGKVEVAYVGGGWCPFCALGNWPLQVALSQFGTFTQLGGPQSSSPTDVYPGLKSWSFTGARYVSEYFKLDAFESAQGSSQPYPPELNALVNKYDRAPYTTTAGGIPFTDLGDHFLVIGSPSSVCTSLEPEPVTGGGRLAPSWQRRGSHRRRGCRLPRGGHVPDPRSVLRPDLCLQVRPAPGRQVGAELPHTTTTTTTSTTYDRPPQPRRSSPPQARQRLQRPQQRRRARRPPLTPRATTTPWRPVPKCRQ